LPVPHDGRSDPRTFFLNEAHELSHQQKSGGGQIPRYEGINWARKASLLSHGFRTVIASLDESPDPLKDRRVFALASPAGALRKVSKDKRKAEGGFVTEHTDFGGAQSRLFDRLRLDLMQVRGEQAIVHGSRGDFEQLAERVARLPALGALDRSRWAPISSLEPIPVQLRFDPEWFDSIRAKPVDLIIELQPVLTMVEVDQVIRAIAARMGAAGRLTGSGTDFSGRRWFRGKADKSSIKVAAGFQSVQSIHPPLYSLAASARPSGQRRPAAAAPDPPDPETLPCVAVVDLGVPNDHGRLARYCRGRFFSPNALATHIGSHGSLVASRVVYGDSSSHAGFAAGTPRCRFYDARLACLPSSSSEPEIDDKSVLQALQGVRGAAPDVRVFNLSIGDYRALSGHTGVAGEEKRLLMQELDNFIFANDVVVAVAAGNSVRGVAPRFPYPQNWQDPDWALGTWACGFNTLVCGSFVSQLGANGLGTQVGWPSPFTRVGPGICGAPIPSFAAEGGNADASWNFSPGLGVWGYSDSGFVEDHCGTSMAVPILAREAAVCLQVLQEYCEPGSRPFGVTVRALLALAARRQEAHPSVKSLADRTLGLGKAICPPIGRPEGGSATIIWQGIIPGKSETLRIQLPVPSAWLSAARAPVLRVIVCYDPPVNSAARGTWACRKLRAVLYPGVDQPPIRRPRGGHPTFPLIDRRYELARYKELGGVLGDLWVLELSYEDVAPTPPGMVGFDPSQRVAFAAHLFDDAEAPIDPQFALQALPSASSMNRLASSKVSSLSPVLVRVRS